MASRPYKMVCQKISKKHLQDSYQSADACYKSALWLDMKNWKYSKKHGITTSTTVPFLANNYFPIKSKNTGRFPPFGVLQALIWYYIGSLQMKILNIYECLSLLVIALMACCCSAEAGRIVFLIKSFNYTIILYQQFTFYRMLNFYYWSSKPFPTGSV